VSAQQVFLLVGVQNSSTTIQVQASVLYKSFHFFGLAEILLCHSIHDRCLLVAMAH
jgi:hypothetical protein